jgi:MFS family permease
MAESASGPSGVPMEHGTPDGPPPLAPTLSVVAFSTMSLGLGLPIVPLFALEIGASIFLAGFVVTVRWGARMVANIPAGLAAERFGNRAVLLFGSLSLLGGSLASCLAQNWQVLAAARFFEGVGSGFILTVSMTLVARASTVRNRGRLFGHLQIAQRLGYWAGPAIGGALGSALSLRASLWAAFIASLATVIAATRVRDVAEVDAGEVTAVQQERQRVPFRMLLGNPQFSALNAVVFSVFFTMGGAQFTAVPLLGETVLGLGPAVIGMSLFAANSVALILIYPSGWASDRYGARPVILSLLACSAGGLLVLTTIQSATGLIGASLLLGASTVLRGPPTQSAVVTVVDRDQLGSAMGLYRTIGDLASSIGPMAAGAMFALNPRGFFVANAALVLAAALIYHQIRTKH